MRNEMTHLHFSMFWSKIMETSGLGSFTSWNTLISKKTGNCSPSRSVPCLSLLPLELLTPDASQPALHRGRICSLRCICKSQHPRKTRLWSMRPPLKGSLMMELQVKLHTVSGTAGAEYNHFHKHLNHTLRYEASIEKEKSSQSVPCRPVFPHPTSPPPIYILRFFRVTSRQGAHTSRISWVFTVNIGYTGYILGILYVRVHKKYIYNIYIYIHMYVYTIL